MALACQQLSAFRPDRTRPHCRCMSCGFADSNFHRGPPDDGPSQSCLPWARKCLGIPLHQEAAQSTPYPRNSRRCIPCRKLDPCFSTRRQLDPHHKSNNLNSSDFYTLHHRLFSTSARYLTPPFLILRARV